MGDPETGDSIDDKMFNFTFGGDTSLHIMPATEGLKNSKGLFAVIIGTVLLAVATAGASLAAEGAGVGLTAEFSTYAIGSAGLGITGVVWRLWMWGMLLTGITSLLTAKQAAPQTGPTTASYLLNGPQQNTAQGIAIPLNTVEKLAQGTRRSLPGKAVRRNRDWWMVTDGFSGGLASAALGQAGQPGGIGGR